MHRENSSNNYNKIFVMLDNKIMYEITLCVVISNIISVQHYKNFVVIFILQFFICVYLNNYLFEWYTSIINLNQIFNCEKKL